MLSSRTRLLLVIIALVALSASLCGQVVVSVGFGPPPLPVYTQPPCPAPGYIWTPGYWSYGPYGYYWVPGTWVMAPTPGYLWTPGYWGWSGGGYVWYPGYWGPQVGFYGGINYGWGYPGAGYYGGYWRGQQFYYNRAVNNVNVTVINNVYSKTVVNNVNVTRVSYNGGQGGIEARPTPAQEEIMRQQHVALTSAQVQHERAAQADESLRATVNQGRPPIAATQKPAALHGPGVVAARNETVNIPATRPGATSTREATVPRPPNSSQPSYRAAPSQPENTYHGESSVPRPPSRSEADPSPYVRETPRETAPPAARDDARQPATVPRPPANTGPAARPEQRVEPAQPSRQPAEARPEQRQ